MKWLFCVRESHWRGWAPPQSNSFQHLKYQLWEEHESCVQVSFHQPCGLKQLLQPQCLPDMVWWPTKPPCYCPEAPEPCTQPILLPHHSLFCPIPYFSCHTRVCKGQGAVLIRALADYRAIRAISYSYFTHVALEEFSTERRSNTGWLFQYIFLRKTQDPLRVKQQSLTIWSVHSVKCIGCVCWYKLHQLTRTKNMQEKNYVSRTEREVWFTLSPGFSASKGRTCSIWDTVQRMVIGIFPSSRMPQLDVIFFFHCFYLILFF